MKYPALLWALLCFGAVPAGATVYYVDAAAGADGANGMSEMTPWRTLARVSAEPLEAGDCVLLRRGRVWREGLVVTRSGAADVPITFGAYGEGGRPVIDGDGVALVEGQGLLHFWRASHIVLEGWTVRNSARSGVLFYSGSGLRLRDLVVSSSRANGVLVFDCQAVVVEDSEFYGNSLDTGSMWAGLRVDAKGGQWSDFLIRNNRIHDNIGGADWNSANGIMLGHTGENIPALESVRIVGNELYSNGNPMQNQAGRGLSASCTGDVTVTGNYVRQNASAGIYLGDAGLALSIEISRNFFYNNALRQYGGITDGTAKAFQNTAIVDDANITAMGAELGGNGSWTLTGNTFYYLTQSSDAYRAFIRINDIMQQRNFAADNNLYYSPGPVRWKNGLGEFVSFEQWKKLGFDAHSIAP